jgi:hypothetical protein
MKILHFLVILSLIALLTGCGEKAPIDDVIDEPIDQVDDLPDEFMDIEDSLEDEIINEEFLEEEFLDLGDNFSI